MIPKKVSERLRNSIPKYKKKLEDAKAKDLAESDTVLIIYDMLEDIFGYEKLSEITSEYKIKGTYCDLAIKVDDKDEFLIEIKAIGKQLTEDHLRQVINYAAKQDDHWVILTNGLIWQVHKVGNKTPIESELVCELDFHSLGRRSEEDQEKLFVICKEGIMDREKDAREQFHKKSSARSRFLIGALLMSDEVVFTIRKELRKVTKGILVEPEDIRKILENEVIKRDVLEGEEAKISQNQVKKHYKKISKENNETDASEMQESEVQAAESPIQPN